MLSDGPAKLYSIRRLHADSQVKQVALKLMYLFLHPAVLATGIIDSRVHNILFYM